MKKKFLSLMMAAAMVATTSVSAFALGDAISTDGAVNTIDTTPTDATGEESMTISEGEGQTTDIGITGNVANNKNQVVPSTISVTVPTAAKFTVTKDGDLVGSNITIKNEGTETVSVIAEKFIDTTSTGSIKVVEESEVTGTDKTDRTKVSLKLAGNLTSVDLRTTTTSGLGIVKVDGHELNKGESVVLDNVKGRNTKTLTLTGKAVKGGTALTEAISDKFTLILRIKKER